MKFIEVKNSHNNRPELINTDHITKMFYESNGEIRINLIDRSYVVTSFDGDIWEILGDD